MFLLKVVIIARPRIIISLTSIGLTPEFLSKAICFHATKASRDPSFPEYLFKQYFSSITANALQRSWLLSLNDDGIRMWHHPSASRFDGPAASLVLCAIFYIKTSFFAYASSLYDSSWFCNKRSPYFEYVKDFFFFWRSMICLLLTSCLLVSNLVQQTFS